MPMPTPEELWKLVADTGLADHDQIEGLRREFGRDSLPPGIGGAAVTELLAKWLVRRKVLTIWQARRLVRGDRGPFFLGDYRLLERLETSGAKGTLLRARHEPSGRGVCLMLLDGPLCRQLEIWTDIVQRTGAAHQASDPMTSRTWALEQSGSQRFIICEDVVGTSLAAELAAGGPLPITEAGPLLVASARAVAELHRLGVVHGGISLDSLRREPPANGGGNPPAGSVAPAGRVRLLQFPLVADPHVVPQRPPLDTPESIQRLGMKACFVAPELLLPASSCDARSDVYWAVSFTRCSRARHPAGRETPSSRFPRRRSSARRRWVRHGCRSRWQRSSPTWWPTIRRPVMRRRPMRPMRSPSAWGCQPCHQRCPPSGRSLPPPLRSRSPRWRLPGHHRHLPFRQERPHGSRS